jgi:hypothetical protein
MDTAAHKYSNPAKMMAIRRSISDPPIAYDAVARLFVTPQSAKSP